MITDIKITNFRGLGELELVGLKRVNLIVGTNNSGKTSLLESIVAGTSPMTVNELPSLFRLGSPHHFQWFLADGAPTGRIVINSGTSESLVRISSSAFNDVDHSKHQANHNGMHLQYSKTLKALRIRSVSVRQRPPDSIVPAFADTVRAPENERRLEQLLTKIDPRIRSARLDVNQNEKLIAVDIGLTERVPLSQVGQGIYRVVSIITDLLGSKPELFLIDEIENGIHWTALPTIWKGLAEIAEALNIQVFATTHSRECLVAAHEVFSERAGPENEDFAVIQLMRVKNEIKGRVLGGSHIEAAIENDIELR